ncbi:hypothetical protein BAME_22890 [Bacillus sp. M 2-6]|nr:hypothetical protein BAME_22890 [Bacillus sp. M 2-6]
MLPEGRVCILTPYKRGLKVWYEGDSKHIYTIKRAQIPIQT